MHHKHHEFPPHVRQKRPLPPLITSPMAAVLPLPTLLILLLLLSHPSSAEDTAASEGDALLSLKASFQDPAPLSSWLDNSTPCNSSKPWDGVVCFHGSISGLRLGGMGLSGSIDIDSLSRIRGLRTLSFTDNAFSGPLPDFGRLQALKALYVSNNKFSGTIPTNFFAKMGHLKKLWISGNAFTGSIPSSISKLTFLMELHLEDNQFTGTLPDVSLPSLKSFNASNNLLEGRIPDSFAKFEAVSFSGNWGLCGPPLPECETASPTANPTGDSRKTVYLCMVVAAMLLVLVALAMLARKNKAEGFDTLGVEHGYVKAVEVHVPAEDSSHGKARGSGSAHGGRRQEGSKRGKVGGAVPELVFVDEEKGGFGMPELMKAAAEVLGNGGLGSAYKAVMANGTAVVVKRMKEMNRLTKDVFDMEMRKLGRLRHENVLAPMAYHYRKDEKLLVFEYVEKGSLLYVLHGDRGPHHAALDWATRLRILRGIARGAAYLHSELTESDLPHGNLKSGNVLLGRDFEPLLVDYGYSPLANPSQASQALFAYHSPEFILHRHVYPKSDVYCLAVIILELLTGKFPSQYLNNGKGGTDVVEWVASAVAERREKEVLDPEIAASATPFMGGIERLLRLAVALAEPDPDRRPDMKEAARRVEEIVADPKKVEEPAAVTTLSVDVSAEVQGAVPEVAARQPGRESLGNLSSRRAEESFEFV